MEVWTGFIVGLFGSLHCIGMCGPIVLALPVIGETKFSIFWGRLLYNIGRVVTYTAMGAVFGIFGQRIALVGLQQYLSVAFGIVILVYVLMPNSYKVKISEHSFYNSVTRFIKKQFAKIISKQTTSSMFTIGLLNGLLPCGFVYVGIAGSVSTGTFMGGVVYMALFGLGTIPVMLATSILGNIINLNLRKKLNKLIPILAVLLAVLFILRGLNLGIPFLSPKFEAGKPVHMNRMHN